MPFDPTKPVQTRDGRKVRIICTDAKDCQPIIALITEKGCEMPRQYDLNGSFFYDGRECQTDLVNVPETKSFWSNVYDDGPRFPYHSREEADSTADAPARLSVLEIRMCGDKLVECIQHEVEEMKHREEGELCRRDGCCGRLEFQKPVNCTCFKSAPCGACMDVKLECRECGWNEDDDEEVEK
jgi:hypothetical protein